MLWCAVSATMIIGPILYGDFKFVVVCNTHWILILNAHLLSEKLCSFVLARHMAAQITESLGCCLQRYFGDRIISWVIVASFFDTSEPYNLYLWGHVER